MHASVCVRVCVRVALVRRACVCPQDLSHATSITSLLQHPVWGKDPRLKAPALEAKERDHMINDRCGWWEEGERLGWVGGGGGGGVGGGGGGGWGGWG